LSGVILISLGVVGLYVGRIFDQVKDRPLFILDQQIQSPSQTQVLGRAEDTAVWESAEGEERSASVGAVTALVQDEHGDDG
jgi:hypothetical protein